MHPAAPAATARAALCARAAAAAALPLHRLAAPLLLPLLLPLALRARHAAAAQPHDAAEAGVGCKRRRLRPHRRVARRVRRRHLAQHRQEMPVLAQRVGRGRQSGGRADGEGGGGRGGGEEGEQVRVCARRVRVDVLLGERQSVSPCPARESFEVRGGGTIWGLDSSVDSDRREDSVDAQEALENVVVAERRKIGASMLGRVSVVSSGFRSAEV